MVNPLIAAVAGGFLLFNSAASPRKAEKKFESELRKAFPAAAIDVTIKGKRGFDVINGKFRSVRVEMRDFQIGPAPADTAPALAAKSAPVTVGAPTGEIAATTPAAPNAASSTVSAPNTAASTTPGTAPHNAAPAKPATPPAQMLAFVTTPAAKDRGHIGHTEIALKNFGLGPLQVASLDASFEDVTYDWKELKSGRALAIERAGAATAVLVLPAASLETLLRSRLQSMQNPALSLADGVVRITGTRAAPIIGTPLKVVFTGRPAVRGNEIRLEETSLSIGGAPVPGALARAITGEINPVFSFDKAGEWPYRIELTSAAVEPGTLTLSAKLAFVPAPDAPKQ